MRSMTPAFFAALKQSHQVVVKAEVHGSGQVLATLDILGGSVNVDTSNSVRRRCSVTLTDRAGTLSPTLASGILAPFGNEVRLFRGIKFPDGTEEYCPIGVFGISEVTIEDSPDSLTIQLDGYDRARKVQRAFLPDTYTITDGTNYATAIRNLIASRVPGLSYNFITTTRTTPEIVLDLGEDPWKAAQDMADSIGCELFFDPEGVCVLQPVANADTAPVSWDYTEGQDAIILSVGRKLTDEQTYNVVVATGENSDPDTPPVRGTASDTNPNSATFTGGPYGQVVRFFASPFIKTVDQANSAARAILEKSIGLTEQANFTALVNPAHEVGDVVQITRLRSNASSRYVLDSFSVPLEAGGTLGATTRKRG